MYHSYVYTIRSNDTRTAGSTCTRCTDDTCSGNANDFCKTDGVAFRELSFSEALKVAKAENKLLFVDCFTTWCGPCRKLSNVVFKDSLVADYFNSHFVNLKMDMEKGEGIEIKKKYEVRGYPTLLS